MDLMEEFKNFDGKIEKNKLDISQNTVDDFEMMDIQEMNKI